MKILFLIGLLTLVSQANAKVSSFILKPFNSEISNHKNLENGLKSLYKNKISDDSLQELVADSHNFESEMRAILNEQLSKDPRWLVKTTKKNVMGNFVIETTIEIPSLIQRPGNHPSNRIIARIYEPNMQRPFCDYKYPASIMLHHIIDDVPTIEKVAMLQASGLFSQAVIVAVIHMPHYGLRKKGDEAFLTADFKAFRKNIMQLTLDVHVLKNYFETRHNVDSRRMTLSGISLGAVLGATVGAFDQSYSRYIFLVGGGDMANILMNRVRTRADSEVAEALKGSVMSEGDLRYELASVDSFTWLHKYENKKFTIISASRDDIVDYKNSVEPLYHLLQSQNNSIDHRINDDTHSPSGSAWSKLKNVVFPLLKGTADGAKTIFEACPEQANY